MKGIPDVLRLQQGQRKQFFCGRHCQLPVLFRGQLRHAPSGLTGDRHTGAALGDHLADLFQKHSRAIQVYFQDSLYRSLRRRYPGCIDEVLDFSVLLSLFDDSPDRLAGRKIHFKGDCVVPGIVHDLRDRFRVLYVLIPEDDLLTKSRSPGKSHADLAGSGNEHYFFLHLLFSVSFLIP